MSEEKETRTENPIGLFQENDAFIQLLLVQERGDKEKFDSLLSALSRKLNATYRKRINGIYRLRDFDLLAAFSSSMTDETDVNLTFALKKKLAAEELESLSFAEYVERMELRVSHTSNRSSNTLYFILNPMGLYEAVQEFNRHAKQIE